jgi:cytochrome P450
MVRESDGSDDPLTDDQLAAQVTDVLSAGHETSAHFITMLLKQVLGDRSLWARLATDDELRAVVTDEGLRTDGPAHSIWRNAKHNTAIAGVPIPRGGRVSVVLGSANRDASTFADPDNFDVARPNLASHVAFGRGIHHCVGAGVARMESDVSLQVLATRLPRLRLADADELSFRPSANLRAAEHLLVEWS